MSTSTRAAIRDRGGAPLRDVFAFWALIVCVIAGCTGGDFDNRQAIGGNVTVAGRPLPKALISFIPTGATGGPKASGVVVDGQYAIAAADGPCPGEFVVKIETISPEIEALAAGDYEALKRNAGAKPPLVIAAKYNRQSKLRATVRKGGPNRFDFHVEEEKPN